MDLGVYALQLVVLIFGCEWPHTICVQGCLNEEQVDERVSCVLKYGANASKMVTINISTTFLLPNDATICGTRGIIKVCRLYYYSLA